MGQPLLRYPLQYQQGVALLAVMHGIATPAVAIRVVVLLQTLIQLLQHILISL